MQDFPLTDEAQMKVAKLRKEMGKEGDKFSDDELLEAEDTMRALADLIIDSYLKMTPSERKKWHGEYKELK